MRICDCAVLYSVIWLKASQLPCEIQKGFQGHVTSEVQRSKFRQSRFTFPPWFWGQSSCWVKVSKSVFQGLVMCCEYCTAKENKYMFSISTENCYSFIQETMLALSRWWITSFNHTVISYYTVIWGAQRGPFLSKEKQLYNNNDKQALSQRQYLSRPKDFPGPVWGLT